MSEVLVNKLNPQDFYTEVNRIVKELKIDYIDAVCFYCEENGIEIETAASMIRTNAKIKSFIQIEGEELNMLPKSSKLPI